MKKQLEKLKEFSLAYNELYLDNPMYDIPAEKKKFRAILMQGELDEVIKAMNEEDIYAVAHELGDLMYALLGTVAAFGLGEKFEEIFNEIHRSNMSKLDSKGRPLFTPEGKAAKSENYMKPDMRKILDKK